MPQTQLRFPSKYLVEVKSFFTTTQYILLLQQNELKKFSMEKDNKQESVETYNWQMLLDVQVSQRAPTEFTIDILPVLNQNMRQKERAQLIQSGNKASQCTQLVLHCAERDKLVAELKHIIYMKNSGGKPLNQLTCWYQSELIEDQQCQNLATAPPKVFSRFNMAAANAHANDANRSIGQQHQICKAKLYPTAIHMLVDRQSGKRSKRNDNNKEVHRRGTGEILPSQNAMGSLLVSGIQGHDETLDAHNILESRMIMGGSGDDEDEAAARSLFKTTASIAKGAPNFLASQISSRAFQLNPVQSSGGMLLTQGEQAYSGGAMTQEELRAEHELDLYNNQLEQVAQDEQDFMGFGDDRQDDVNPAVVDVAIGAQMTTFGANYGQANNPKLKDKYSEHAIYFNEISQVLYQVGEQRVVSMVKENQEIEQVIFKDDSTMELFIDQLLASYLDLMKRPLQLVQMKHTQKVRSLVDFLKWPGYDERDQQLNLKSCDQTSFKIDIQVYSELKKSTLPDYSICIDQSNVYLVNSLAGKPVKQMSLISLQILRVVDDDPNCNLMLTFDKDVQINIKAATYADRERLISCVLTMRNLALSSQRGIATLDKLKVFHNRTVDHSHQIQAYAPIEDSLGNFSQSHTIDYESSLIRKLAELMSNEVQTMQLDNVIDEILLNATFCYINKVPDAFVKVIMADLNRCFSKYLEYEEQKSDLIDVYMQKSTLPISADAKIEFLSTLFSTRSSSLASRDKKQHQLMRDESLLFKNERHLESLKALEDHYEQTVRYLNVLKSLLNSRIFMQEMANQEGTLQLLTLLLISKSPLIAQLSAQVLKASCHHHSGSESRIEKLNKRVLIRGSKSNSNQSSGSQRGRSSLHPSLQHLASGIHKNRAKNGHFFEAIFDYMRYFDKVFDEKQIVMSLHLTSLNLILSSMLQDRQISTSREDLAAFAAMVSHSDYVTDERASNKPNFQLFDKFSLLDAEYFDIQYMFTVMLTQSLDHFFEQEDFQCLRNLQDYMLTYSIQFIWHLYLLMTSKISHQRTLSIKLLARLLHSNQESHDLLLRILPVTLFQKVKASRQSIESLQWNFPQWAEFFTQIVPRNFDSATEQWNDKTRSELTAKLLKAKKYFSDMKQLNTATITSREGRELMLPIHEFDRGMIVTSRWKNLKWNYREFEVQYECLAEDYLVGRYFLTRLLLFDVGANPHSETISQPQLSMQIEEPAVFWSELLMQFMASQDEKEQTMIVMTLCVLYRQHFESINEMKTIPYWLKLIEHPEYAHVHFLLLQLLFVSLSVGKYLAKANMQLLIKAKGFHVLHNCMNLVFKDLAPAAEPMIADPEHVPVKAQETVEQLQEQQRTLQVEEIDVNNNSHKHFEAVINFTISNQLSRYFKRNSLNVCKGILALRIVDQVFTTSMQFQYHLPMPTNSEYMLQKHALATLAQMIMLQNQHLTREVLVFIEQHLNNHFTLYKLKHSGLIEFLILALNTRNGDRALQLLLKIQEVCITFNGSLDFEEFNTHDMQIIREDKEAALLSQNDTVSRPLENTSGIFGSLDFRAAPVIRSDQTTPLFDDVYNEHKLAGKRLPPVLESIFLRYLPTPFIKFLFERGQNEFLKVYRMNEYRHPILIWDSEQRQLLEARITLTAQNFISELRKFAQDPVRIKQPTNIPMYTDSVQSVVKYPDIEAEVRCGRYYLNVWTEQAKLEPDSFYQIPKNEEEEFQMKMKEELRQCIEVQKLSDSSKIITLLKSCRLALKRFSLKRIQCLSEIRTILVNKSSYLNLSSISGQLQQEELEQTKIQRKMILFTGMRIINMAINEDQTNLQEILSMDGVKMISDIISHILSMSNDNRQVRKRKASQGDDSPIQQEVVYPESGRGSLASPSNKQEFYEDDQVPVHQKSPAIDDVVADTSQTTSEMMVVPDEKEASETASALKRCQIDRIDAKTLNLCVQSITTLINEDTPAFMEQLSLVQRIRIFKQMSQLLDLSFSLFPLLEQRQLKQFNVAGVEQRQAEGEAQSRGTPANSGSVTVIDQNLATSARRSHNLLLLSGVANQRKNGAKSERRGTLTATADAVGYSGMARQMTRQQTGRININTGSLILSEEDGHEDHKRQYEHAMADNSDNSDNMHQNTRAPSIAFTSHQQNQQVTAKARGGKDPDFDYQKRSLMSIIEESKLKSLQNRPDAYSICLIFNITSSIFRLIKSVALYPLAHPELIASGLFWRTIQHCFFDLTEKLYRRSTILKQILKDCTISLKLLVTFSDKFMKCRPEEQQRFYTLATAKVELEILKNFHECIKRLFTAKILEKLFINFVITRELKLELQPEDASKASHKNEFLRLFSTKQLQSPELVWNDETRSEMQAKLKSQILSMTQQRSGMQELPVEKAFCNEIKGFEYSVNLTELRIQGIFVKYFNEQCRQGTQATLSKGKLAKFADQIIEKLQEFSKAPHQHANYIKELVEAFKNLVVRLNLVIKSETDFDHYFETLCNLIQLQVDNDSSQSTSGWEINEVEKRRLFELSSHVLEIVRTLVQRRLVVPQIVYQVQQNPHQMLLQQQQMMLGSNRQSGSNRLSQRQSTNLVSALQPGQQGTPVMLDSEGKILSAAQQAEHMTHLNHGNCLLKCQPFFRLLVRTMYQREIQAVPFKRDVIPMLNEMIGIPGFVMHLFIDRGLIMCLLNLIFDTKYASVISKQMRATLTDQVLKIDRIMQGMDRGNLLAFSDRQSYGVVKAFIPPSFFAEINEQMWRMRSHHQNELLQLQMQFLDNFDADYFENALVKWDKSLREQSQVRVRAFCEKIWNNEPIFDLRTLDQIVNMELEKEERIIEVILRNYNHNPAVFINTKLNIFITEVATQLFAVSQQLYTLRQDDTEGMLKLSKLQKLMEDPQQMTDTQRRYKYLCYQAQLQLTALLLCLEQLLYNEYNPNLLQTRQDEKLDAQSRLTAQLILRTTDIRQVEEKVFRYFNMWLQYPVFLDDEMSEHIRITFLQALFLIFDIPQSMQYFKKTEVPLDFISGMIARVEREQGQKARIIEDSLILLVAQKMLRVDLQYTCPQLALKDTLDQLVRIAITKRPLSKYIKQILFLISQNTHYSTNVNEVLERNNGSRQDLDRLRGQSADFLSQVWRPKPNSAMHARTYYEWSENHVIQRTLYDGQLNKLPILSPDSIKKIKYELLPENLRDFIENRMNNSQHSIGGRKTMLSQSVLYNSGKRLSHSSHSPYNNLSTDQDKYRNGRGSVLVKRSTQTILEAIQSEEQAEFAEVAAGADNSDSGKKAAGDNSGESSPEKMQRSGSEDGAKEQPEMPDELKAHDGDGHASSGHQDGQKPREHTATVEEFIQDAGEAEEKAAIGEEEMQSYM